MQSNHTENAFLVYLHLLQYSPSFVPDLQKILRSISAYSSSLQNIFYLILPSLSFPSSLLPEILSFYNTQLELHSNDSFTLYVLTGASRLFQLSIPENLLSSTTSLLQFILAPFVQLLQQTLQAKQTSRRRGAESTFSIQDLCEFAGECKWQFTQEQTMSILTAGYSLLPWFYKTSNQPLFQELSNASFEFCKSKYPTEFKISSILSFSTLLHQSISLNEMMMKRIEVFILNGSNYASRLNTCKECCMLCNLLLFHFSQRLSARELYQSHEEENQWIVTEVTSETIQEWREHERLLHWSFTEYGLLVFLM